MSDDAANFVRANTAIAATALVPEIRLYLASAITPIWQASETSLARDNVPPPYWAFAWPGGQALARYVLDHREIVRDGNVLDFAAGSGIGAIAAALRGAHATANDCDPYAAAAIALNAPLNAVDVELALADLTQAPPASWDVVLAGDVFYEKPMAERVLPWLAAAASAGAQVLVADPGRAYVPRTGLVEIARYEVPTTRELEDREIRTTIVYRLAG